MKNDVPVFTELSDPKHFQQYVDLRRCAFFRRYPKLPENFGLPDEYDHSSRIVYALRDGMVVGGARLTVSTPESPQRLPLEGSRFRLSEFSSITHLDLETRPYGEISRMAVSADDIGPVRLFRGISNELTRIAASLGVDVIFSICPDEAVRLNKGNARKPGVRFAKYEKMPTDYGIDMSLCVFTDIIRACGVGPQQ